MLFLLVLLLYILELLTGVCQNYYCSCNLFAKLMKLFISFFNLLVESLVLNFELFKIDEMEAIRQLFFLFKDFFEIGMTVAKRNILKTVLVNFLILFSLNTLPILNYFCV